MGEFADMVLDGEMCEGCGVFLGGGSMGFPRKCAACGGNAPEHPVYEANYNSEKNWSCDVCCKMFRSKEAMRQHRRDKHDTG